MPDNFVGFVETSYKTFGEYACYELVPNPDVINGFNGGAYFKIKSDGDNEAREVFIEPEALLGVAKMFAKAAEEVKIK